jgi:hypothetical protein
MPLLRVLEVGVPPAWQDSRVRIRSPFPILFGRAAM